MELIKKYWSAFSSAISAARQALTLIKIAKTFPGVDKSDTAQAKLRSWLQSLTDAALNAATLTETPTDNDLIDSARQLIADDSIWSVVANLITQMVPAQTVGAQKRYQVQLGFESVAPGLDMMTLGWILRFVSILSKIKEKFYGKN